MRRQRLTGLQWALIGVLLFIPCACAFCFFTGLGTVILGALGLGAWVYGEARPAQEVADAFLAALRDETWDVAYALCTPSFQQALGSPDALAERYGGDKRPASWSFNSWRVVTEQGIKRAELGGTLTTIQGERFTFSIELRARSEPAGEVWEVHRFDVTY